MSDICYINEPELESPDLIMGFAGWPDAGEVSTGTVNYLTRRLKAKPLAFISTDKYYDFVVERPTAVIREGIVHSLKMPKNEFFYVKSEGASKDLIFFTGHEPHSRWEEFADAVLDLTDRFKVETIFTIGGTYDDQPHWLDPNISVVFGNEKIKADFLDRRGPGLISATSYEGPISIHSLLLSRTQARGVAMIALWGHAPIYIQTGNVKVHKRIIEILSETIPFEIDTSSLDDSIRIMDERILNLADEDPKFSKFIKDLEESHGKWRPVKSKTQKRDTPQKTGKVIDFKDFQNKNGRKQ